MEHFLHPLEKEIKILLFGTNEGTIYPIQLTEITFLDNQHHETFSSRFLNNLPKKKYIEM